MWRPRLDDGAALKYLGIVQALAADIAAGRIARGDRLPPQRAIAEALNEGWRPDWANSNEYKYWPWFVYNPAYAGFSCAAANGTASTTTAHVGSRLCYKTRELATYAGRQFEGLYNDFLLIKK